MGGINGLKFDLDIEINFLKNIGQNYQEIAGNNGLQIDLDIKIVKNRGRSLRNMHALSRKNN